MGVRLLKYIRRTAHVISSYLRVNNMFQYLFYLLLRKPYLIQTTAIISKGDMSVLTSGRHHLCRGKQGNIETVT